MSNDKILGIEVEHQSKSDILEKIKKYIVSPSGFWHVVSLNPEIFVLTTQNEEFKEIVRTAQIKIVDGVGTVLAGRWLGVPLGERMSGVDMMEELVRLADDMRLRVVLIGAKGNLALKLADCYRQSYKNAKFLGIEGFNDVLNPEKDEEEKVNSIVTAFMPQIALVAFGSPMQELWIARHSKLFKNCLCMGVGGAFDFLSGQVPRAPKFMRAVGVEWLFRLVVQPWRWRRQLRLIKFISLVFKEKFSQ